MKRILSLLLCALLLLGGTGCQKDDASITLYFYYPMINYGYDQEAGKFSQQSIQYEIRDDIEYKSARQVLEEYLKGPVDPSLITPFPAGIKLLDLSLDSKVLYLTVSDELSELTGIPLTIACSCLASTAMKITPVTKVEIKCQNRSLDGKRSFVFSANTTIFSDSSVESNS